MFREYTYTRVIGFDFDAIIDEYELDNTSTLGLCRLTIFKYVQRLDDEEGYLIDNVSEIAYDLYNYLQSKNH